MIALGAALVELLESLSARVLSGRRSEPGRLAVAAASVVIVVVLAGLWAAGPTGVGIYCVSFAAMAFAALFRVAPSDSIRRRVANLGPVPPRESTNPVAKQEWLSAFLLAIMVVATIGAYQGFMGQPAMWTTVVCAGGCFITEVMAAHNAAQDVEVEQDSGADFAGSAPTFVHHLARAARVPEPLLRPRNGVTLLMLLLFTFAVVAGYGSAHPAFNASAARIALGAVHHALPDPSSEGDGGPGSPVPSDPSPTAETSAPESTNAPSASPSPQAIEPCDDRRQQRQLVGSGISADAATRMVEAMRRFGATLVGCQLTEVRVLGPISVAMVSGGVTTGVVVDGSWGANVALAELGAVVGRDLNTRSGSFAVAGVSPSLRFGRGRWQLEKLSDGRCRMLQVADQLQSADRVRPFAASPALTSLAARLAVRDRAFPFITRAASASVIMMLKPDRDSEYGFVTTEIYSVRLVDGALRAGGLGVDDEAVTALSCDEIQRGLALTGSAIEEAAGQ